MKMEGATLNGDWVKDLSYTFKKTNEIWHSQFTVGGPVNSSCAPQHLAKFLTKQVRSKAEGCCSIIKAAGSSSCLVRLFIASFNSILFFSFQWSFRAAATISCHVCEPARISNVLNLCEIKMLHVLKVKYSLQRRTVEVGKREKDKPTLQKR